jgi:hypothetical protein
MVVLLFQQNFKQKYETPDDSVVFFKATRVSRLAASAFPGGDNGSSPLGCSTIFGLNFNH